MTISAVSSAAAALPGASASALGALDSGAFLNLLVAQLRYQNPMAPSDPSAMLQQSATFTQVETTQQLLAAQQQASGLQEAATASSLVGREIVAAPPDGPAITGVVEAVRFTPSGTVLRVAGTEVPLLSVSEVRAAPVPAAPASPGTPTPGA
jgi:flagellar basal-body rod modification protein FlgD